MHYLGVPGDARGLVDLKLADEVPAQVQPERGALGGLGRRFLIPVLAESRLRPSAARWATSEAGKVFVIAISVTSSAERPAAAQAAAIRSRTAAS